MRKLEKPLFLSVVAIGMGFVVTYFGSEKIGSLITEIEIFFAILFTIYSELQRIRKIPRRRLSYENRALLIFSIILISFLTGMNRDWEEISMAIFRTAMGFFLINIIYHIITKK